MSDLRKQERTAIEAVAKHFSATWETGDDPSEAHLIVAGKRVAVDIATRQTRRTGQPSAAKPRLRFDKSVNRLMEHLQAALGKTLPHGITVLFTVTAPIRLRSKTAAALEEKIQTLLGQKPLRRDQKATIHGNRVQIRLLRHESARAPKMIGFVHNPDSDALLLLNMTTELLARITAAVGKRAPKPAPTPADKRWLVLLSADGTSLLETYRYICSQLPAARDFAKVFMVFASGHVELLAG
jgi:hypothetical protein